MIPSDEWWDIRLAYPDSQSPETVLRRSLWRIWDATDNATARVQVRIALHALDQLQAMFPTAPEHASAEATK